MDKNPFEGVLDRLREKGWRKDGLGDDEGPNCLYGGQIQSGADYNIFRNVLTPIITDQYPDRVCNDLTTIVPFNNHPDTTFADVERVLEKAAVKWEEERVLRHD